MWYSTVATMLLLSPPPCVPGDLDRFPPCIHTEEHNDQYTDDGGEPTYYWITGCPAIDPRMAWLKSQLYMRPREWIYWDEQISQQEAIEETWKILWYARCRRRVKDPDMCVYHLLRLRELLGEADYALGRMPNPIPLWRYERVGR